MYLYYEPKHQHKFLCEFVFCENAVLRKCKKMKKVAKKFAKGKMFDVSLQRNSKREVLDILQ